MDSPGAGGHSDNGHHDSDLHEAKELEMRELWLPIANVARIMKAALPPNAKISKEAKECVQECVSEFVSFITSEASDKCIYEKRKTVNGEDILFAMASLGMDQYSSVLQIYLAKYRESQMAKQEKEGRKKKSGENKNGGAGAAGTHDDSSASNNESENVKDENDNENNNENDNDDEPYAYEGNYPQDDGQNEQAIYEDYTGHYTNVDMQY